MGKLTISMAIFNNYVSLPEGIHHKQLFKQQKWFIWPMTNGYFGASDSGVMAFKWDLWMEWGTVAYFGKAHMFTWNVQPQTAAYLTWS